MEEKKTEKSIKKIPYDELKQRFDQLLQQNDYLVKQLYKANMTNMFKRLDYLFMVLQNSSIINDPDFIGDCVAEIKSAMTVGEDDKEPEE